MKNSALLSLTISLSLATAVSGQVVFTKGDPLSSEPFGRQHPPGVSSGLYLQNDSFVLLRPRSNPPTVHRSPLVSPFVSCSPNEFQFSQVATLSPSGNEMLGSIFSLGANGDNFVFLALDKEFKPVVSAFSRESLDLIHSSRLPIEFRMGSSLKVIGDAAYIYGPSNAGGAGLVVHDLRENTSLVRSYSFGSGNAIITDVALNSESQLIVVGYDLGTATAQAPFNAADAKVFAAKHRADSLELQSLVSFPGQVGPYFLPTLALDNSGTRMAVVFDKDTTIERFHPALAVLDQAVANVKLQIDLTDFEDFGSLGMGRASSAPISEGEQGIVIGLPTGSIYGLVFDWETNSLVNTTKFPKEGERANFMGASISDSMVGESPVWLIDEFDEAGLLVTYLFSFCPE